MWPKNMQTVLLLGFGFCRLVHGTSENRCADIQAKMRTNTGNPTLELQFQSDTKKCCQAVDVKIGYGYNPCTTDGGLDSSHPCPPGTEQRDAVPSVYRPQCTEKICQSANTYLDKTRDICVCNIADGFCGTADGPQALTNNLVDCELVSVLQTGCQGGTILQDCTCALHGYPSKPTPASKLTEIFTRKTASPRKTSSSGTRTVTQDPATNSNAHITTEAAKDTGRTDTKEEIVSDSNIKMKVGLGVGILAVMVFIMWMILDPRPRCYIRKCVTRIEREKPTSQDAESQEPQQETTPKSINDEEEPLQSHRMAFIQDPVDVPGYFKDGDVLDQLTYENSTPECSSI